MTNTQTRQRHEWALQRLRWSERRPAHAYRAASPAVRGFVDSPRLCDLSRMFRRSAEKTAA
jgi:hypothetical protein